MADPPGIERSGGGRPRGIERPDGGRPRGAERDAAARAALQPLGEREWPVPLRIAIAVAILLAAGVIAGAASIHDLSRHGGSLPGAALLAVVLLLTAQGMYRRRYWAVLGFEALLAFQIIVTSLALVVASTLLAAAICLVSVGLGGWLFWKLIRVMGRIQAGEQQALR
ncbi:MAG TPA: hypothetical protein VL988_09535 [Solirubrobacteraceae bacterium]|nr:hypothetical protein [Solirubrobacteraceae bacterium]